MAPEDGTNPLYNIGMVSFGGFRRKDGSEVPPLYPVLHREDEQIPLYIIWDAFSKNKQDDLEKLLEYFVLAVRHIERSIPDRYKDRYVKKEPFDRKSLEDFNIRDVTLAEVLEEYQKLEYSSRKEELKTHYRLPPAVRAMNGKSAVIRVSKIETDNGKAVIHGRLLLPPAEESGSWKDYDPGEAPLFNLDESSWVVVTSLKNECEGSGCIRLKMPWERGDPAWKIARSPLAIIQDFDRESGEVTVVLIPIRGRGPFLLNHTTPKLNPGWIKIDSTAIAEGSYLILDPSMDDLNMNRAYLLLEEITNSRQRPVYSTLQRIYSSNTVEDSSVTDYKINIWNRAYVEEFLKALEDISKDTDGVHAPNDEQRKFIADVDHFLVTLQGPPGTGKTSGAVAPAIMARAYASIKQGKNALFIVTGVSHRAINEALTRTTRLKRNLSPYLKEMDNIEIYRLASSKDTLPALEKMLEEENFLPGKEGVILESADNSRVFLSTGAQRTLFEKQARVRIVFATPGAIYKLFRTAHPRADLVVIDEVSMMDLPTFVLATMGAKLKSQILLVGDHRQMQPIQTHRWEIEDRKTIEENVPFLSAINFVRFLRGEIDPEEQKEFENLLYRDPPFWESKKVRDDVLPVYRLTETHRLLPIAAEMHTELIYKKDGIELKSKKKPAKTVIFREIQTKDEVPKWVKWTLDPGYPYVVIEHFDTSSTKANELEAQIVSEIIRHLPSDLEVGVVVPYRAHKALIYKKLQGLKRDILVDTVERFQGAEKDIIIVSMASSDPTYLAQVFNFIYDQNRFNVAASRAKEKLILVAAKSFFTASAFDLEKFEKVRVWKRFYLTLRNKGEALPSELSPEDIQLNGYRLDKWDDED
ncbi:DEAD/DEAH box helicase [Thermococcus sp.]|uniref:DEAD/DEAH box helicase n=1 Tax=Thermococcus sp. TaxID=35749 RepID=UPI00261E7022|nr:DEAD/DEAH box helicase [Thermococcus sp.]